MARSTLSTLLGAKSLPLHKHLSPGRLAINASVPSVTPVPILPALLESAKAVKTLRGRSNAIRGLSEINRLSQAAQARPAVKALRRELQTTYGNAPTVGGIILRRGLQAGFGTGAGIAANTAAKETGFNPWAWLGGR